MLCQRGALFGALFVLASSSPPAAAGIFGISAGTQLFRVNATGGMQPIGAALADYAAGPGLGAIDARAGVLYSILLKEAPAAPFLVGIRLADGSVASSFRLPFADAGDITLGHLALKAVGAAPTVAVVGGVDAGQQHLFGTVTAAKGGDFRRFANVSAAWNDVGGCATAYIPATDSVLVQFNVAEQQQQKRRKRAGDFEISVYSISLANGTARALTEDLAQGRDVQTLGGYDAATGRVLGLGWNESSSERELVELDPEALSLRVIAGNVSADTIALNGMSAFDSARRSLFWVGKRDGTDAFDLVETSVLDGSELSRAKLCDFGDCPMVIAYFPGANGAVTSA